MQNEMVKEQDFKELFSELKGIGIEEAKSIYFDEDALKLPPKQLYRLDYRGYRYYYSYDEEGKPKFYISATTMIKNSLPTPPQLIDWMASMGKYESKRYSKERADYGTFMHIQAADFMIEGSYDLDSMDDKLKHFLEENNQPQSLYDKWIVDLKKDVLSFAQFAKDVDLKPIAIEITLSDDKMGVAGTIDIVAQMTIKVKGFWGETYKSGKRKGEDKETYKEIRILCIIDMKS